MNKKIFASTVIALTMMGISISSVNAKETVSPKPISADLTQVSKNDKVNFEAIKETTAPENLLKKINVYKDKEGFVYYIDSENKCTYIAIMRGEKPTGGFGINVKSVDASDNTLNIIVEEVNPGKDSYVTEAVTYPCTIIKINEPAFNINVQNTSNKAYSYYDISRNKPIIGVSSVSGTLTNIYIENNITFLEIKTNSEKTKLFYEENNEELENTIKDLKINDNITITYALGTPKPYGKKMAMPINKITSNNTKINFSDINWLNFSKNLKKQLLFHIKSN